MKCCKCGCNENVTEWRIFNRGYGSIFDIDDLIIPLCDGCKPRGWETWVNELPEYNNYMEEYQWEDNIESFLSSLSIEQQESIMNTNNKGETFKLPPYLWIKLRKEEIDSDKMWGEL